MEMVVVFIKNEKPPCYEALTAPNVRIEFIPFHAAASVREHTIDLAVIDCGNDFEAGLRVLKEIKQCRPDLPVIFIAEASSEEVVLEAFKLGARDYFRKPLDLFALRETAAKILGFKRIRTENGPEQSGRSNDVIRAQFPLSDNLPEKVLRAISYINDNLFTPLCLDLIARQACLSKFHFCRLFKLNVGVSPKQYCVFRRIEYAKQILCRQGQNITNAAFESGFNDVTGFIRQFKKATGVTPGAYRESQGSALTKNSNILR